MRMREPEYSHPYGYPGQYQNRPNTQGMNRPTRVRPLISIKSGKVIHGVGALDEKLARVVLKKGRISVACTDATPEALRFILAEYDKAFPSEKEVVLQDGCT